jgi:hypothetical protein
LSVLYISSAVTSVVSFSPQRLGWFPRQSMLDKVVGFFRVVTEEKCSIIAKILHLNSFFQSFIHCLGDGQWTHWWSLFYSKWLRRITLAYSNFNLYLAGSQFKLWPRQQLYWLIFVVLFSFLIWPLEWFLDQAQNTSSEFFLIIHNLPFILQFDAI